MSVQASVRSKAEAIDLPWPPALDHCGPLTATVEDCAIMLQAIAGYDARDPSSADVEVPDFRASLARDLKGMRVGALPAVIDHEAHASAAPEVDPELRRLVQMLAERAGLALTEPLLLQLCKAAPYAFAMSRRVPALEWEAEPANIFRFPAGVPTGKRQST